MIINFKYENDFYKFLILRFIFHGHVSKTKYPLLNSLHSSSHFLTQCIKFLSSIDFSFLFWLVFCHSRIPGVFCFFVFFYFLLIHLWFLSHPRFLFYVYCFSSTLRIFASVYLHSQVPVFHKCVTFNYPFWRHLFKIFQRCGIH